MAYAARARAAMPKLAANTLERDGSCGCGGRCTSSSKSRSLTASAPKSGFDFGSIRIFPDRPPATGTLVPVGEGTETLSSQSATTADSDAGAAAPNCSSGVSGGSFSSIPNGVTLPATLTGNKLGATFSMVATFVPTQAGCASNCGEYRQYVRGQFVRNGTPVAHALCSNMLDPATYYEDCANIGGTIYKYGYHTIPFGTSYFDNPDQPNGLTFHGYDAPGLPGSSGDNLSLQLDFRGQLVDACNGDSVFRTAEWSVAGAATVP
jgi:hypothetical protein